ncbi:unnamed protein product [Discosporangium mesarthrocarpum]
MGRYRGPRLRIIRRLGELPGLTAKIVPRYKKTPGQHGKDLREQKKIKPSAYKIRLYEKQKLRYNYGLTETQLLNYIKKARRKTGLTGFLLMQLLEMRLDNIIFRLGLAPTIPAARQYITHGHILINNSKVNIPSFQCQPHDIISLRKKDKTLKLAKFNLNSSQSTAFKSIPNHLEFDRNLLTGKVKTLVGRKDLNFIINDMLVIEYYSRLI